MTVTSADRLLWDLDFGVWVGVNGGCVEIGGLEWSGRRTPAEASRIVEQLSAAVAEANSWAKRYDPITGTYTTQDSSTPDSPFGGGRPAPVSQHGPGAGQTQGGSL